MSGKNNSCLEQNTSSLKRSTSCLEQNTSCLKKKQFIFVPQNGGLKAKFRKEVKITLKLSGQKATVEAGQTMPLSGKPKVSPEGCGKLAADGIPGTSSGRNHAP